MGNSNTNSHFSTYYDTGDIIGRGTFAVVKKCYRKSDKKEFAVKIVDKRQLTAKELVLLKDEIKMLRSVEYVYVIKMLDVFDNGAQVKMVLELCTGGNLFDLILKQEHGHLSEKLSAQYTAIIGRALKYLHSHHIVHRDLKPENILFMNDGTLKVTDFGLAHFMKVSQDLHYMHTCCGTPHYVAPEVLTSNGIGSGQYDHYGYHVDYWSLGVMVYIMLSGKQPFNSRSINAMYQLIIQGTYKFESPFWDNISSDAKDLIKSLMCVDFNKRMTYDTLIKHSWITHYVDENEFIKEEEAYLKDLQQSLKQHDIDAETKQDVDSANASKNDAINDAVKNNDNITISNRNISSISHSEKNINTVIKT